MRLFLVVCSLVVTSIAGGNVALVPFLTARLDGEIYGTVFWSYCVLGTITAAISAWIGVKTGLELPVMAHKVFGRWGKRVLAVLILAVSLPASSLTGGLFAGLALQNITGWPFSVTVAVCLATATLLACGWGREMLKLSNRVAVLVVPAAAALLLVSGPLALPPAASPWGWKINLPMVMALWGYNAGGMRPAIIAEAAAYMRKKGEWAVWLAAAAKLLEGLITMGIAYVALRNAAGVPLALADAAGLWWGDAGRKVMTVILLCVFFSTMAPAMMVNARQLMNLTAMPYSAAMALTLLCVTGGTILGLERLLHVLMWTGLGMAAYTVTAAWLAHKCCREHRY